MEAQSLNLGENEVIAIHTLEGLSMKMPIKYSWKTHRDVITAPYPCSLVGPEGIALVKIEKII
jgi:hypothetical protein